MRSGSSLYWQTAAPFAMTRHTRLRPQSWRVQYPASQFSARPPTVHRPSAPAHRQLGVPFRGVPQPNPPHSSLTAQKPSLSQRSTLPSLHWVVPASHSGSAGMHAPSLHTSKRPSQRNPSAHRPSWQRWGVFGAFGLQRRASPSHSTRGPHVPVMDSQNSLSGHRPSVHRPLTHRSCKVSVRSPNTQRSSPSSHSRGI